MKLYYYIAKVLKKARGSAVINSHIHPTSKIESGSSVVNSTFDKHSFCGYDCEIVNANIGSFCSIASNVKIGGAMHPINWVGMSPVFYDGKDSVKAKFSNHLRDPDETVTIGNDIWIGQNVLIKQGLTIGTGAVIGMGSVVTKDVGPYEIVGGNPAKLIRKRFDDNLISELLNSKWWDFEDSKLTQYAQYFTDPKEFLKQINK